MRIQKKITVCEVGPSGRDADRKKDPLGGGKAGPAGQIKRDKDIKKSLPRQGRAFCIRRGNGGF